MQVVKNGVYGEIQQLNNSDIERFVQDPEVDRVEVFQGTEENIEKRKKMIGKKYKVSRAFKKAPSIKTKNK